MKKSDTILLQYTFYQFQYFIKTCLCAVEIYQETFQSHSFNRIDLVVLFNWGWSRLINKLSLIKGLVMFATETGIIKGSKSIEQLNSRT